ncbi:hypothetical protein D3C72_1807810 [compost metagenome]
MAEAVGQGDEIALRVDDALLHPLGGLLKQAAQQMGLARPGIALHQKARGEQFLEVHMGGAGSAAFSHVDGDLHHLSGWMRHISSGKADARLVGICMMTSTERSRFARSGKGRFHR